MSAKQDRQGVRTAAQLEQKWKFGESFAEAYGIATDARQIAQEAEEKAKNPAQNLTQDQIFEILTDKGESQGMFREENGEVYINAEYLKGNKIKGITLESADGKITIDMSGGQPVFNTGISTNGITVRDDANDAKELLTVGIEKVDIGVGDYDSAVMRFRDPAGNLLIEIKENEDRTGGYLTAKDDTGKLSTEIMATNEKTGITLFFAGDVGNEPHGYFRMNKPTGTNDPVVALKCDDVDCTRITAPIGAGESMTQKVMWVYDDHIQRFVLAAMTDYES
jgi:hypothetical protein